MFANHLMYANRPLVRDNEWRKEKKVKTVSLVLTLCASVCASVGENCHHGLRSVFETEK